MSVNTPVARRSKQTIQSQLERDGNITSKVIAYTMVEGQEVELTADQAKALYDGLIAANAEPKDNLATLPIPESLEGPLATKSGMPIKSAAKTDGEFESITTVGDLSGAGKCTVSFGGIWVAVSDDTRWSDVSWIKTDGLKNNYIGHLISLIVCFGKIQTKKKKNILFSSPFENLWLVFYCIYQNIHFE